MSDREWCCDRLEENTTTKRGWAPRVAEIDSDGSLNLLRVLPEEGGCTPFKMDFSYCPFCGKKVTHNGP